MVPHGHAAPYSNPRPGVEVPFFTMGPFTSMDTLFPGAVEDRGGGRVRATNSLLFCHTIEYQGNMTQLVTRSQEAIQALHEHIWKVVHQVMDSADKSVADGLEIAIHLVDMLLSISLQLTFNTVTAGLPGFTPESLTYASLLSTDQGVMTVLSKEILKGAHGAEEKVMQATWHVTVTDTWLSKGHDDRKQRWR